MSAIGIGFSATGRNFSITFDWLQGEEIMRHTMNPWAQKLNATDGVWKIL